MTNPANPRNRPPVTYDAVRRLDCPDCGRIVLVSVATGRPIYRECAPCCSDPSCPSCHGSGLVGHPSDW